MLKRALYDIKTFIQMKSREASHLRWSETENKSEKSCLAKFMAPEPGVIIDKYLFS